MHPEPTLETVKRFYPEDYGCHVPAREKTLITIWRFKLALWCFSGYCNKKTIVDYARRFIGKTIENLVGRRVPYSMAVPLFLPKNAAILDVGYGNGNWLLAMRKIGYTNLYGVDIDEKNKNQLEEANIKVYTGDILNLNLPENFFDLIRLEHVFEHLIKPKEHLSRLGSLLKPTGYLVMNLPNIKSLNFYLFRRNSSLLELPRHIYHWSPKSISMLALSCGLKVKSIRTLPVLSQFTKSFAAKLKKPFISSLLNSQVIQVFSPIYALLIGNIMNQGDFFSVVFKKQD
jgi:2-polyprenyl-3-methyl-5-hydroxy-6-metoxy-1,4-benzoquinol methylase